MLAESSTHHHSSNRAAIDTGLLIFVSVFVRIAFLLIKPTSAISLDMLAWIRVEGNLYHGLDPYELGLLNYPPLWPAILIAVGWVSRVSGIQFVLLMWTLLIVAESLLLAVAYRLMCRIASSITARNVLLIAIALNPAAIFQVTQHGNFDVIVTLWMMLSVDALFRFHSSGNRRDWLAACGWLGIGVLTKTMPLLLAPLLAIGAYRLSLRTIVLGAVLLFAPVTIGMAILLALSPQAVWENVVMYRSLGGYYGIHGLVGLLDNPLRSQLLEINSWVFQALMALFLIISPYVFWKRDVDHPGILIGAAGLLLLALTTLGPGFGSQYLYWYLPFLAVSWPIFTRLEWKRMLVIWHLITAITYLLAYSFFVSHGAFVRALFPFSDFTYRMTIEWTWRYNEVFVRLPMFCASLGVLFVGTRELFRRPGSVPVAS